MKENVGRIDQVFRSIAGPALIVAGYAAWGGRQGRLPGLAALVAGVAIADSAITRVCIINGLLGIDSRSAEEKERDLREAVDEYRETVGNLDVEGPLQRISDEGAGRLGM